jgi:DNA polymerase-3 subunit alpha
MKDLATHTTANLEGLDRGADVSLCGILTGIQRKRNKEGKLWASMQFEDLAGSLDAVLFTTSYERLLDQLAEDKAVLVKGSVLPEDAGPPKISVQDIVPLELAGVQFPTLISIRVPIGKRPEAPGGLRNLCERKPGDTAVRLRLEKPGDFSLILDLVEKVRPDREFRDEIERLCGPEAYEVLAR